jgi:aminoglycoside phosphotransferase (APT) family kinase protein
MEVMCELMDQQTKNFPPALRRDQVLVLGEDIKKAAVAWMDLGIPDTLGHLDLNPGNVVVSDGHCVFLDWAEACIGPPFLTFDFLRAHFCQTRFADDSATARIAGRYGNKWNSLLSAVAVNDGLRLASLLAPYAYAVGTDLLRDEEQLRNSNTAGYLRSLVRRMQRESRNLRERGISCLSQ